MKKEIKWSIAAVLLLCMGLVVYFLFLRPAPVSHTTFFLAEGLASQTECHIMDSGKEGPTIFLLAGTHGNEPAGFKGAEQLLERLEPKTGRIILVPHANQQAIELNQRTASDGVDMNRSYPGAEDGNPIQVLSAQIMELIQKYQPVCVVDMHEGVNFYGVNGSIGNSIVVGQTQSGFINALDILEMVNSQNGDYPDFALEGNAPVGSLNCTASRELGIDAFTIETSQKLPMEVRVSQQVLIVTNILQQYGMEFKLRPESGG